MLPKSFYGSTLGPGFYITIEGKFCAIFLVSINLIENINYISNVLDILLKKTALLCDTMHHDSNIP